MSAATSVSAGSVGGHSHGTAAADTVVSMDPQERHRSMTSVVRMITGGTVAAAVATTAVLTVTLSAQADDTTTGTTATTGTDQGTGVTTDEGTTSSGGSTLTSSTAPTSSSAQQGHARSGGS